jgi:hypothetical protein
MINDHDVSIISMTEMAFIAIAQNHSLLLVLLLFMFYQI